MIKIAISRLKNIKETLKEMVNYLLIKDNIYLLIYKVVSKMDYKKLLEDKELRPASVKLYSIKLKQLDKELGNKEKNLNFLLNTKKVLDYINTLNSNDNKLANLNAILKVIEDAEKIKYYQKVRNDLNKIKFEKYKDNVKTDAFVEYDKLLEATPAPDFTKSLQDVINDTMLYFSVRYPMRLILPFVEVVRDKKKIQDNKNYIYITKNGASFYLNDFKNVQTLGKQVVKLPAGDFEIVKKYLQFLKINGVKSNRFILNFYLKPLEYGGVDMYARNLKKHLKQRLNKDITMNDIRKSYSSALIQSPEYQNMTNSQKEVEHNKILHNTFWSNLVYNRV
jgi:hypothetical protein